MLPLNYHHLYYFWATAKAGRISEASRQLLLSQSTLSTQIQQLERSFGRKLLERSRKGVALTAEGRVAFDYCERIFSQGEELAAALRPGSGGRPPRLRLGIAGTVSRHVVAQVLEHVRVSDGPQVSILSGPYEEMCGRLEKHRLDIVLSSVDFSSRLGVEFISRLAGTIPIHFVAVPELARRVRRFPSDLSGSPMLLMAPENPVRQEVDLFLCRHSVGVSVEAEIEDFDLLHSLALSGNGVAAIDALTVRQDVAAGRLKRLHREPVGINEHVWFICGRHPKPNPLLQAAMQGLMKGFSIRI